jgi:predicted PurR-regulated permease PerM
LKKKIEGFSTMTILPILANLIDSVLRAIKIKRAFAFLLASVMIVGTFAPASAMAAQNSSMTQRETQNLLDDDDSDRPKTTREWKAEARETSDQPLERTKRIVEETADAVQDWAELYPDVAERSIPALEDDNR